MTSKFVTMKNVTGEVNTIYFTDNKSALRDIIIDKNDKKVFQIAPQSSNLDATLNFTLLESSQSTIDIAVMCLDGINLNINLTLHKHATVDLNLKCKCHKNNQVACNIIQNHVENFSTSNVKSRAVCDDNGTFKLSGSIKIPNNVNEIFASQYGKGLLLSDNAHIKMTPFMQVASKNVSCNHGFAIGGINPDELIYCHMRGIPLTAVKQIISAGLLN